MKQKLFLIMMYIQYMIYVCRIYETASRTRQNVGRDLILSIWKVVSYCCDVMLMIDCPTLIPVNKSPEKRRDIIASHGKLF